MTSRWSNVVLLIGPLALGCGGEFEEDAQGVATQAAVTVPSGFRSVGSWTGVTVYRKDYSNGYPDFVTVVDLRRATLRNLTGTVTGAPSGSARVTRKSLGPGPGSFWADAVSAGTATNPARVVLNGTFFDTNASPTRIAFGLRANGVNVSYGYGLSEFPSQTMMFAHSNAQHTAALFPWRGSAFGEAPDLVGVLSRYVNKSATAYIPRSLLGVRDDDGDGATETVLFFSSRYSTQSSADSVLRAFGATETALLDSGASSGLIVGGTAWVPAGRSVPHALAIFSGP